MSEEKKEAQGAIAQAMTGIHYNLGQQLKVLRLLLSEVNKGESLPEIIDIYRHFFSGENPSPEMVAAQTALDVNLEHLLKKLIESEIQITVQALNCCEGGAPC